MPPRRRKTQQKNEECADEVLLSKRTFVERSRISKHLSCPICMDVFTDPVMPATCQHIFCRKCLIMLSANSRTANIPCPQCRKNFRITAIKTNLLAASLINELEIYCSNKSIGCEWRGEIERVGTHLKICSFGKGRVPAWLADHQRSMEQEELALELLDDHARDLQLNEQTPSLAMRLFKPLDLVNSDPSVNNQAENNGPQSLEAQRERNEQLSKILGASGESQRKSQEESKGELAAAQDADGPGMEIVRDLMQFQRDIFAEDSLAEDNVKMDLKVLSVDDKDLDQQGPDPVIAQKETVLSPQVPTGQTMGKRTQRAADLKELVQMGFPQKRAKLAYEQSGSLAEAAQLLMVEQDEQEGSKEPNNAEIGMAQVRRIAPTRSQAIRNRSLGMIDNPRSNQ